MKLNIKGLVFVGFAAAVFASAAQAEGDKIVTSKTYVDAKYVGSGAVSVNDGASGTANANKKVITVAEMGAASANAAGTRGTVQAPAGAQNMFLRGDATWQTIDGTAYTGSDGVTVTDHNITNSGVRAVATGTTPGTISVNTNGTSADVAVNGLATVATSGSYADLIDEPTAFDGTANGLVPSSTSAERGYFLKGDGTWAQVDSTAYTGSDGVTVTDHNITNSGVRAVTTGTTAGTISVNTNGTSADVAVNGLATVATSGSYNDLLNQPTIGSATLTITDGTTTLGTFNANATEAVSITVPNVAVTIPAPTSGTCGTGAPCALVIENGVVSWETIQQ